MGHNITALVIADAFSCDVADALDLVAVALTPSLTMFHLDHYYTAYWQAVRGCTKQLDIPPEFPGVFPREAVVAQLVAELTGRDDAKFALIQTEYFGGTGSQWACAFNGPQCAPGSINDALRALGVIPRKDLDEFDTVGLGEHRHSPEYLERYVALCDERGV